MFMLWKASFCCGSNLTFVQFFFFHFVFGNYGYEDKVKENNYIEPNKSLNHNIYIYENNMATSILL